MSKGKPASALSRKVTPFALAFGGLFALVGLILFTAAWLPVWNEYRHGQQFAAEGAVAAGMVLTKSRVNDGGVMVLGYTQQLIDYSVRYRFTTHSGQKIEGDAKVTPDQWGLLEERGFIKVRYLADAPATNHVSGQVSSRSRTETRIFTLIGAFFTAVGGLMVFIVLKGDKPAR